MPPRAAHPARPAAGWEHRHTTGCPQDCARPADLRTAPVPLSANPERILREAFAAGDPEGRGVLEDGAVGRAVAALDTLLHTRARLPAGQLKPAVSAALAGLDRSAEGCVDLQQFVMLLGTPELAPAASGLDLAALARTVVWPAEPELASVLLWAKELWDAEDSASASKIKGQLSKAEFGQYLERLWAGLRDRFSWDGAALEPGALPARVQARFDRFDDYLFYVNWAEFLEMIAQPPWRVLLPPAHRLDAARVIQQSGSGDEAWRNCEWVNRTTAKAKPAASPPPEPVAPARWSPSRLRGVERAAWEVFDSVDSEGTGELGREELRQLVMLLWSKMGREMPAAYEQRMPAVVQHTLAQFDSEGTGTIRFADFLNMLSHSPWRVLLPPAEREAITMPQLRQRENRKVASSASRSASLSPPVQAKSYPMAIPPPPPQARQPAEALPNTATSHTYFASRLRGGAPAAERPKPLKSKSRSPQRARACIAQPCHGNSQQDTPVSELLEQLSLGELAGRFASEGFRTMADLLSVRAQLTTEDLVSLGLSKMMDRKRFLKELSQASLARCSADYRGQAAATTSRTTPKPVERPPAPRLNTTTAVLGLPRQPLSPTPEPNPPGFDPFEKVLSPQANSPPFSTNPLNHSQPSRARERAALYDAARRGKPAPVPREGGKQAAAKFGAVRPMPTTTKETLLTKDLIAFHSKPPATKPR